MNEVFSRYLFTQHILTGRPCAPEEAFQTCISLAQLFAVQITEGQEYACADVLKQVSEEFNEAVPEPFYRGFPQSVRELSPDQLLFDQVLSYLRTYGFNEFSQPVHSLLEKTAERSPYSEKHGVHAFVIMTEEKAREKVLETADNLLSSTRPLNAQQYEVLLTCVREYGMAVTHCAAKHTAVKLLLDTGDLSLSRFLKLPDVMKVMEQIGADRYGTDEIKKVKLRNKDRKLITGLINELISAGKTDIKACCEKQALWAGLLHQIHYKPVNDDAKDFADAMRSGINHSVYSDFEKEMSAGNVLQAQQILQEGKGSGEVLRKLNYLLSRCRNAGEVQEVLNRTETDNTIILLQMQRMYALYRTERIPRTFVFTKNGMIKTHTEADTETAGRRSLLSADVRDAAYTCIENRLQAKLKGKAGRVYIDPAMKSCALPLAESASQGGFGVLACGSRKALPEGNFLRVFTYWEKVNDIDLAAFGLDEQGNQLEFSWRTMASNQSMAVTYSGDETSGYKGGSEYFDIDTEEFRRKYPGIRYVVFTDNVYSMIPFSDVTCTAGYMVRNEEESGRIFEARSVQTQFKITCASTFAYLFGIDLSTREMVWMNMAVNGSQNVAGESSHAFLLDVFRYTEIMSMHRFFSLCADTLCSDPAEADVIVSDTESEREGAEVIRSWDFAKIMKYMNN